ncbi:MAG: transposase [Candidatus Caldarchaeum sp.]
MNSATRMLPTLLTTYAGKGRLLLLTVDIGVCDVALGLIELGDYLRVLNRTRIHRPVHLISFVRRVNRRSMRIHKRPASSWLRYLKAREHQWVSDTVHAVVAAGKKVDAVVIEDLNNEALKRKLKSKDPDASARYSTWMPAKLQRRIIAACVNKNIPILKIPPQYSSHICPRCSRMMIEAGRRRVQCTFCGMNDDRDNIAIVNLARTAAVASGLQYLTNNLGQELRKYEQILSSTKLGKKASETPAQSLQGGIPSLGGVGEAAGHPTHRGPEPPGALGGLRLMNLSPMTSDGAAETPRPPAEPLAPSTADRVSSLEPARLPGESLGWRKQR